jgi:hypothetical protein
MWDDISISKSISERSRKGPNFVAGKNIAIVPEKLNLVLSAVLYNLVNNCIQDTGKVKSGK